MSKQSKQHIFIDRTGEIIKGLRVLKHIDDHFWQFECVHCGRKSIKDLKSLRRGVRCRNSQPNCPCGLWKTAGTFLHVDAAFVRQFMPAIKAAIYVTLKYPGKLESIAEDCLDETVLEMMTTKFQWPKMADANYEKNMKKVVSAFAANVAFSLSRQKDLLFVPIAEVDDAPYEPYDVLINSITDGYESGYESDFESKYVRLQGALDKLDLSEREFLDTFMRSHNQSAADKCRMARLRKKLRSLAGSLAGRSYGRAR